MARKARSEDLLVEHVGDETVVYDLQTKEAHCLSPLASVVFAHSDGSTEAETLAAIASQRLGRPLGVADVEHAADELEARALLEPLAPERDGVSRRDVMRTGARVGVAATVLAPLITTITAPAALATTQTLIPVGGCCGCGQGLNSECAGTGGTGNSGHCCQVQNKSCNNCKCVGDSNDCSTTNPIACGTNTVPIPGSTTKCCASGQQPVQQSDGSYLCCNVVLAPGGVNLNCG